MIFLANWVGYGMAAACGKTSKQYYGNAFSDEADATVYGVRRLIPNWALAQTWGNVILVRTDILPPGQTILDAYPYTLRHEYCHVEQYRRYGWLGLGFWAVYLYQWIACGFHYANIKLEEEARAAERLSS